MKLLEKGDRDIVLTVANCEAERDGRWLNHLVGAIIQRRESWPEPVPTDKKRTLPPKVQAGDVLCQRGARSQFSILLNFIIFYFHK